MSNTDNARTYPTRPYLAVSAAIFRDVREETGLEIAPLALVGFREAIARDDAGRVERHFVILPFAARWVGGEIALSEELAEAHWRKLDELTGLKTTEGLAEIIAAAAERMALTRQLPRS